MIRAAKLGDIQQLIELFHSYYLEGNLQNLSWDTEKMTNSIYNAVINEDSEILVVDKGGVIIGAAWCEFVTPYFTDEKALECRVLYIAEAHRGGLSGSSLIKQVGMLGKKRGVPYIDIGTTSEIQTERTARLYKKLGFKHVGYEYRMEN